MAVTELDLSQRLVDENGHATAYFEELMYNIALIAGGGGTTPTPTPGDDTLAQEAWDLAIADVEIAKLRAMITVLSNRINDLEATAQ